MQKCVLISSDTRAAQQMRGWFRLFANKPYLEIFPNVKAFDAKYSNPIKQRDMLIDDQEEGAPNEEDSASFAQKLEVEAEITPIRLFIVDLDSVTAKPLDWLVETRDRLRNLGHVIEATAFRTLLLGYDDPHLRPERFRHEAVDDMVIKPLDQQLFLQKVELLLADKPDISPTFIFRARAEGEVEIGKDAVIDEISDFAISIRNPAPIAEGVFAQIHSRIFGTSVVTSRILGRCYASIRHPQFEGLWLVRFSLFGLTGSQLVELRKFVRGRQMPGRAKLTSTNRKPPAAVKNKLPPRYRLGVIDLNRDILAQAQGTIEENFDRTAVTLFPSYTRFLAGLAKLSGQAEASGAFEDDDVGAVAVIGGIPGGRTTLVVKDKDYELLSFEPAMKPFEHFLGRGPDDWKARPFDWISSIPKTDHEDFNEFLSYTATGGQGVTGIRFVDNSGGLVYAEVKGRYVPADGPEDTAKLRLDVKQIEREAWIDLNRMVAKGVTPDQYRFDALIIDGGLIQTDTATWLDGLHAALTRAQVILPTEPLPRIFILADEESRVVPSNFTHRGIADFTYKPLDRKLLTDKLSVAVPQLSRTVLPENSPFVPCELTAQVCKNVGLEELSEFGVTVRHPTPFKPRIFMRFFSPLFGDTSEGVLARCVASLPAGPQDPTFKCHFVFFGCSDELHKRIRNWIREDYVHKKENSV
jgi:hypothetical protein